MSRDSEKAIPIGWSILGETISALDKPADWLDASRPMMALIEGGNPEWDDLFEHIVGA